MNAKAYRQMIADGHQPTAQDVVTLCDEVDALQRVNRILDDAAKDAQHYAYQLQEARAELAAARSAPVAVEVPELPDLTDEDYNEYATIRAEDDLFMRVGYNLARSRIKDIVAKLQPIDPSRILKDGERAVRWIPVEESLPEDGERVGFIAKCAHDLWDKGRSMVGTFHRKSFNNSFGGFTTPAGVEWDASHWCRLPPVPDAILSSKEGAA